MSEIDTRVGAGGPRRLDDPAATDTRRATPKIEDIPTTATRYNGFEVTQEVHRPVRGQARNPEGHPGVDFTNTPGDLGHPIVATGQPEIDRQLVRAAPYSTDTSRMHERRYTAEMANLHLGPGGVPRPLLTEPQPAVRPAQLAPEPFQMDFTPYESAPLTVPLIAVSGHDGAGKSTLARAIAAAYGGRVIAFGDALKSDLERLGYSDIRTKPTPAHYRALMRAHGGAARITHGADYWVRRWMTEAQAAQGEGARVIVCDDLRHVSELLGVWKLGGLAIALVRPEVEPDPADLEANSAESIREVWAVRSRIESALLRAKPQPGKFPDQVARASVRQVPPRADADALAKANPRSHLAHLGLDAFLDQELNHDED